MQGQVSNPLPLVAEMEDALVDWKVHLDKIVIQVAMICKQEETARHALEDAR